MTKWQQSARRRLGRVPRALRAVPVVVCLAVGISTAAGTGGLDAQTIQPRSSETGSYLDLSGDIPLVMRSNGQRAPVPVRSGEQIDGFAELSKGWIATGTRARPSRSRSNARTNLRRDLLLITGGNGPIQRLSTPGRADATIRRSATPVLDRGELVGLVWLEGPAPRSLSVMAAPWNSGAWGPATTISGPGPGSQIAPTATVSEDGSWFVAWSRFDGRDDEIFWSQLSGANWSRPVRAHSQNTSPDVAPTLAQVDGSVFLAWSRYDGDQYRAVVSRWAGGRWQSPRNVGGSASAFPEFVQHEEDLYVLFQDLAPSGWTLTQISPSSGAIERQASYTVDERDLGDLAGRPLVTDLAADAPRFQWPQARKRVDLSWTRPLNPQGSGTRRSGIRR